jgi:hypothetical protein
MADEAHPPLQTEPPANAVLAPDSLVRDTATGERTTPDRWLDAHAAAEQRPRDECVDALMNAIARGDLVVERPETRG